MDHVNFLTNVLAEIALSHLPDSQKFSSTGQLSFLTSGDLKLGFHCLQILTFENPLAKQLLLVLPRDMKQFDVNYLSFGNLISNSNIYQTTRLNND